MPTETKPPPGPEVLMPCRRGHDIRTEGQRCISRMAYNLTPQQGAKSATFQCTKCNYQWTVPLGGQFNF